MISKSIYYRINIILFSIFRILASNSKWGKEKKKVRKIIIIKPDAIGDYFIFRNFLECIQKSTLFSGCYLTLLGNNLWKEVAYKLDSAYVNDFIWITPSQILYSPLQTIKLFLTLRKAKFDLVLNPTFSRNNLGDAITFFSNAPEIIGCFGDLSNMSFNEKVRNDKKYTRLIKVPDSIQFEFDRYKFFFEQVLDEKILTDKPYINFYNKHINSPDSIMIFFGAGVRQRSWPVYNFKEIVARILDRTVGLKVILAGGLSEVNEIKLFSELLANPRVINKVGKTSLAELVNLIDESCLVVTNESGALHIAVSTNTPTVCLLGGGHFGRFAPYPKKTNTIHKSLYFHMDCFGCNWKCIFKNHIDTFPCILNIGLEEVWENIFLSIDNRWHR